MLCLADKPWQKVLLAYLLFEKNTVEWLVDRLISSSEHCMYSKV